jgi:hypothetical protein
MTVKLSSALLLLSRFFVGHSHFIKRTVTTTMASSIEESSKTKTPDEKRNNLLAKRFVGLEKNIL